jgi:hypothetical protein
MDAVPATQYRKPRPVGLVGWGELPGSADSVEQVGVKWALAVLALLGAILTLMLAPAVVAVISMVDGR